MPPLGRSVSVRSTSAIDIHDLDAFDPRRVFGNERLMEISQLLELLSFLDSRRPPRPSRRGRSCRRRTHLLLASRTGTARADLTRMALDRSRELRQRLPGVRCGLVFHSRTSCRRHGNLDAAACGHSTCVPSPRRGGRELTRGPGSWSAAGGVAMARTSPAATAPTTRAIRRPGPADLISQEARQLRDVRQHVDRSCAEPDDEARLVQADNIFRSDRERVAPYPSQAARSSRRSAPARRAPAVAEAAGLDRRTRHHRRSSGACANPCSRASVRPRGSGASRRRRGR